MSVTLNFEDLETKDGGLIPMDAFEQRLNESIARYDELKQEYGIAGSPATVPDTGVR